MCDTVKIQNVSARQYWNLATRLHLQKKCLFIFKKTNKKKTRACIYSKCPEWVKQNLCEFKES